MTYIENTFICLAAPLLLAIVFLKKDWQKSVIFLLAGMTSCILSKYVDSFFIDILQTNQETAVYTTTPVIEELIKFLPVLFYIVVFQPEKKNAFNGIIIVAVGFATFENVCFLIGNEGMELLDLVIRGLGTGAMHVVCGLFISLGFFFLWDRTWLRAMGTFGVLCISVTFHAILNILLITEGVSLWVGSLIPLAIIIFFLLFIKKKIDVE